MKTIAILALVCCIAMTATAWPLKHDDKEQRMEEAEQIAGWELEQFKQAVASNDNVALARMTNYAIDVLKEAQANNQKLNRVMPPLMQVLKRLTSTEHILLRPMLAPLKLRALHLLTTVLDGNRDNLSYYRLEAVREWIERRTKEDGIKDSQDFADSHASVIAARDALEAMASTFVAGLKDLKEETSHIFREDRQKIKMIADNIIAVAQENGPVMVEQTAKAERSLQQQIDKWY